MNKNTEKFENLRSICCDALPIDEVSDNLGFCSKCKDHACFEEVGDEKYD